jgi:hypothetical protein
VAATKRSRKSGGLRAAYRTLELPATTSKTPTPRLLPGFSPRKDLLKQLLDLNLDVAARIEHGEPVTAPGIPPDVPDPKSLITDDCIRPANS